MNADAMFDMAIIGLYKLPPNASQSTPAPPEGLCPFGRSGSRDRAKKEYTLCELCVSSEAGGE